MHRGKKKNNGKKLLFLYDDRGRQMPFEILDRVRYKAKSYLVLIPADEEDADVVIVQVVQGEEGESYRGIRNEQILDAVFNIFIARVEQREQQAEEEASTTHD